MRAEKSVYGSPLSYILGYCLSFNKSFRRRYLRPIPFCQGKNGGLFTMKPKQTTQAFLAFVNAHLAFINFLNRVERSKEACHENG